MKTTKNIDKKKHEPPNHKHLTNYYTEDEKNVWSSWLTLGAENVEAANRNELHCSASCCAPFPLPFQKRF